MSRTLRILFLASCLEPGRDGVGDYVRLLAEACARQGHRCAIVALNDSFVPNPIARIETDFQTLRLPASMKWPQRMEFVRDFRKRFVPDWISFNIVPYAFHRKGILLGLVSTLRELTAGTPLHVMFHELWLGAGRPSPLRFYVTGHFQSSGIRRLVRQLKPQLVTTSNPVYAAMLRSRGIDAGVMPLFGNVPLEKALPDIEQLLPETGITRENRGGWWIGLFFGALPEQWKSEPFLGILLRAAERKGQRVCLVLAGRSGAAGRATWEQMQRDYGDRIAFINLEEQPAKIISALLQMADFGIAGSPWQLIGKSGTAAAMLDHGLPVIVTRDDFQPFVHPDEPPSSDPLVHRCDEQLEAKLAEGLPRREPRARVHDIAEQLCDQLRQLSSSAP